MNFPEDRRYIARDPKTGLVHQCMAYDEEAYGAALTIHATWCFIEVDRLWVPCDDAPLSCLSCLSETPDVHRIFTKPGIATFNTKALSKINFPFDDA